MCGLCSEHRLVRRGVRENDITSEVTCDVISLGAGRTAIFPPASETKVVGALSADVVIAEVVVEELWVGVGLGAVGPKTDQGRFKGGRRDW